LLSHDFLLSGSHHRKYQRDGVLFNSDELKSTPNLRRIYATRSIYLLKDEVMDKIPFSIYDFFSYLFAGFLLLIGIDYAFGLHLLIGRDLNPVQIAFWIVASYITGHINSHWASWLIETKILGWLGKPEDNLFADKEHRPFKHYRKPLPAKTARLVKEKYKRISSGEGTGQDLFIYCFNLVKEQCPQALARLTQFLYLYGFNRNLCFASFLVTIALLVNALRFHRQSFWVLSGVGVIATTTLFFRYLKFYRHYSVEVFSSFLTSVKEPQLPQETGGTQAQGDVRRDVASELKKSVTPP